jgi:hypothetical protein
MQYLDFSEDRYAVEHFSVTTTVAKACHMPLIFPYLLLSVSSHVIPFAFHFPWPIVPVLLVILCIYPQFDIQNLTWHSVSVQP